MNILSRAFKGRTVLDDKEQQPRNQKQKIWVRDRQQRIRQTLALLDAQIDVIRRSDSTDLQQHLTEGIPLHE